METVHFNAEAATFEAADRLFERTLRGLTRRGWRLIIALDEFERMSLNPRLDPRLDPRKSAAPCTRARARTRTCP